MGAGRKMGEAGATESTRILENRPGRIGEKLVPIGQT
jgi:hypothetical protein